MKKFLGFDLEIAKELPDGASWKEHRPLGITCASAVADDVVLHWEADFDAPFMSVAQCQRMLIDLRRMSDEFVIVTWNGLQFDFDVLQEESQMNVSDMAMDHIDIMFQFFCMTGYPVGLDVVAKTMGLHGKLDGMTGALAPAMWKINPQLVVDYVIQDGRTTLDVANAVEKTKRVAWVTKSGKYRILPLQRGLLSVRESLEIPLPDQSWMNNPMSRESFMEWMKCQQQ